MRTINVRAKETLIDRLEAFTREYGSRSQVVRRALEVGVSWLELRLEAGNE